MKREEEVAVAIAKREEEIMEAVRNREAEVYAACVQREELIKRGRRTDSMGPHEGERVEGGGMRLEGVKKELEETAKKAQQQSAATTTTTKGSLRSFIRVFVITHPYSVGRKEKSPLEEVKNLLEPMTRTAQITPIQQPQTQT